VPIYAKAGASFTPAPAGVHAAVCIDVIDLGELEVSYAGKTKRQHKIKIIWQIDEDRDDGKPFHVQKRYTLSLHEKAGLRKDLESWRGKPFSDTELQGFDVENLLGVAAMLNIVHAVAQGSTFANIASIMRLAKGMQAPAVRDYVRVCDRPTEQAGGGPPQGDWGPITDDDVPF